MTNISDKIYPTDIQVLQKERHVNIVFSDNVTAHLPFSYLRCNSPSAENKGHGLITITPYSAIEDNVINIIAADPVGNYAIKFVFDDGHQTGLFTWEYLYKLTMAYLQE